MKVVHCKKDKYTVYIGRPSKLGNIYKIGPDGNRDEVIIKYKAYAVKFLLKEIAKLKEDDILGCWCKPLDCHGDVIIEIWHDIKEGCICI